MNSLVAVRPATIDDLDRVIPLFDAYRQFYRAESDIDGARRFILERFKKNESVIFLPIAGEVAVGFTQLYPSFSSVSMSRIFILNDLFVAPEARSHGAGAALLQAAAEFGRSAGAVRLVLSTELTNKTAQSVYERLGWVRDAVFCSYQLNLR